MENDLDIIRHLNGDQVVERAKALMLELEYWQQVLDDAARVNEAVLDGTNAVLEATVSTVSLLPLVDPAQLQLVESIVDQQRKAVEALKAIAAALNGTVELAAGRQKALKPVAAALRRAAGLEPDDDDPVDEP